ncbi:MAG TPA: glycosyltransferase [Rhizomicrobium sp.]|jgi:spore maturation protein CgeB
MKIVWFVHALASCWNNGNAHFLRGLGTALQELGHEVLFLEPSGSWSETNLIEDQGTHALDSYRAAFPNLATAKYDAATADLWRLTDGADVVVVHEWNPTALVNGLGRMRAGGANYTLLFQDTHHRAASDPDAMRQFDLSGYDGVLAFGATIADLYRAHGWSSRVWSFHEAADTNTFFPRPFHPEYDLVWIGNWGDEERTGELREFLIDPATELGLSTRLYGVRYPEPVIAEFERRGIAWRGWLPNHHVPLAFARARFTVHVPRRLYARLLPGVPTIRVFEALACGIPLICSPWEDCEELFPPGCYLVASDGTQMRALMRAILADEGLRQNLRHKGLAAIRARHSCRHRARELLGIVDTLKPLRKAA